MLGREAPKDLRIISVAEMSLLYAPYNLMIQSYPLVPSRRRLKTATRLLPIEILERKMMEFGVSFFVQGYPA